MGVHDKKLCTALLVLAGLYTCIVTYRETDC